MINTKLFETDVVIGEIDENKNIKRIDFINQDGMRISSCKYRAKKINNKNTQHSGENQ